MGWELGGGLGHVMPMLAVARRLRDLGHRCVFALRDVVGPSQLLRGEGFSVVPAPMWQARRGRDGRAPPIASFADILINRSFADEGHVTANLAAWDGLIEALAPDLVVADYAPGLCLAARGRVPVLAMSNGFCLPPPELEEFPALQPKIAPLLSQSDLLARLNAVQQARGSPRLPRLPALFDTEARFISCVPLLDPYAGHRHRPADGPLESLPAVLPMPPGRRVFVYFDVSMPGAGLLMEGLVKSDLAADVFLRGASAAQRRSLERPSVRVYESPPPLDERLAECSLAVHYCGLGTATACLAAGRPQLLMPSQLERWLSARTLNALGVAGVVWGELTADKMAAVLRKAVADEALAARAAEVARGLERGEPDSSLMHAVEQCLSLIGGDR